jgi:hypothetical protein
LNRFPGQEDTVGDSKIPTIVYYDTQGAARAAGAEATLPTTLAMAEEEQWVKAEWSLIYFVSLAKIHLFHRLRFKLLIRPKGLPLPGITDEVIPPLPPGKTALQVYSDFLRYLHQCAHAYIIDTHAGGDLLWENTKNSMMYVLAHPNGWEGIQQGQLRTAAVNASLVPNEAAALDQIRFVPEGEASIHFCITRGLAPDLIGVCPTDPAIVMKKLITTEWEWRHCHRRWWGHNRCEYVQNDFQQNTHRNRNAGL